MANCTNELAEAIAGKYVELEELSHTAGVYGAIRLDWARYGESGLDDILEAFRAGLDSFSRGLSEAAGDGEYVRNALKGIMDEKQMDDGQRRRFLSIMRAFAEQSGADQLKAALSGKNESVLQALLRMSEAKPDGAEVDAADKALDDICAGAQAQQDRAARAELHSVSGEEADELLRCYAAYCVLRDGKVEGMRLSDDCFEFIGASVKAGAAKSAALKAARTGRITGEQAAEVLRAAAEVTLVAMALFASGAMGAYAALSVIRLAGILLGFTGALGGAALAIGIICGLPVGVKVTCDMLRLCAKAGTWLENNALSVGAEHAAEFFDNAAGWVAQKAPELRQSWDDARAQLKPHVEKAAQGLKQAWQHAQPHVEKAANGAVNWLEQAGGELNSSLNQLFNAFGTVGGNDRT